MTVDSPERSAARARPPAPLPARDAAGDASAGRRWRLPSRRVRHAVAGVVILASAVLMLQSAQCLSPTPDEGAHMMRGLAVWWTFDTRLSHGHPPLGNALYTLPGALLIERYPIEQRLRGWDESVNSWAEYARDDYPAMRAQILLGRSTAAVLAAAFFGYFYLFCCRFFGWPAALAALVLLAFNPTVLAHATQLTTDFPATAGVFIALGELLRWLFGGARWGAARFGLAAGSAVVMKYSAIPVVVLLALIALAWPASALASAIVRDRAALRRWGRALLRRLGELCVAGVLVLAVINAAYLFQRTGYSVARTLREPEVSFRSSKDQQMLENTPIGKLPKWLVLPLPFTFVMGVGSVYAHAERGHDSWFLGERSRTGDPRYYPLLFLLKTPAAVLALLVAGLVLALVRRRRPRPAVLILTLLPLLLLASMTRTQMNIGFRHALPLIPMVTAVAGLVAARLVQIGSQLRERSKGFGNALLASAAFLVASAPAPALAHFPEYLGYFNVLVGRQRGHDISIVGEDWGQDVVYLAKLVKERELSPLYYDPYSKGHHELRYFEVPFRRLRCNRLPKASGFVAVHRSQVRRRPRCFRRVLAQSELFHTINDHIDVYRYEAKPKARRRVH